MAAYVITRINVTDPAQYEEYKKLSPGAAAAHGGKFIVRGGESVTLEGPIEDRRLVVLEFPDIDSAKAFYDSELYVQARAVRAGAAEFQMVAVEGA
ncbi:DUF1330 domain-containing protein [Candidatus Poriferisodalis sp.]|uniref:DUF1330 domain-containing protein n=1 Tax=Candidatus Poriferisodalis sp. TaxID=3101277 RepID=UPI003C6F95A5